MEKKSRLLLIFIFRMSNLLTKLVLDKKYFLLFFFWLLFLVWRTSVFLNPPSSPESGIIQGMAFASHHGYQRGIKAYLKRRDQPAATAAQAGKEQQEFVFPLSYSGTFKAYNLPPGEYQIVFTNQGYHPAVRNTIVRANSVTTIPPVTLERAMGSDYFYHFVHTLNIFAFAVLLTTTKEILKNADETLKLIASIRAELKKDKPQYSEAKIEEMVESAIQIIKRLTIKNIDIKKRFSENLPTICVEKTRFVHVLVNLLQNAVDSFEESGNIEITSFAKDSKITLEIKDNGCGIPYDEKDKIFSGFYSTKEDNIGLGLFFAKQEIQRYGGDITCLSEPSVGTTMIITLPIKHNAEEDNSDNQTGIFKRFKDYAKEFKRRAIRSFLRNRQSSSCSLGGSNVKRGR